MIYRVTKKFDQRGPESPVGNFNNEKIAKTEILKRLEADALVKVKAIYCLYEGYDLLEQIDQNALQATTQPSDESSSSGASQGSSQRFSPSPLSTSPRPSGMPPSSWKKEDESDKDKK